MARRGRPPPAERTAAEESPWSVMNQLGWGRESGKREVGEVVGAVH